MKRAVANPIYTGIAWLPFVAVAIAVTLVLALGAMQLEQLRGATNFFHLRTPQQQHAFFAQQMSEFGSSVNDSGQGSSNLTGVANGF